MKHPSNARSAVRYLQTVLILLLFAVVSMGATRPPDLDSAVAGSVPAQTDLTAEDEEQIKSVINAYFKTRFEGQAALEQKDFSATLADDTLPWVKKEQDKREIQLYMAMLFDLQYVQYHYDLDYEAIDVHNNKAEVKLSESYEVVFASTAPDVSEFANIQHDLVLHKKKDTWLIYSDESQDELSRQLEHTSKLDIKKQVLDNYEFSKKIHAENDEPRMLAGASALTFYSYSNSAAVSYANNYAKSIGPVPQRVKNAYQTMYGSPYPSNWPQYYRDETNNDCTNFVSQAVFAGTTHTSGDANYFYPTPNDSNWYYKFSPTAQGSTAWRNVGWFYDFINNNTGRGPVGYPVPFEVCSLSPGDVVMMQSGSTWQHAVIVVSKGSPCSFANLKVNAHDTDAKQVPISNYSNYTWYGVDILGYYK